MAKHRVHSIEFKRQVVAEYAAGETLYGLARRHDVCRNLIRVWVAKAEAGEFDEEIEASNLLSAFEAKIAALERLVGRQALELEFLKGALKQGRPSRSGECQSGCRTGFVTSCAYPGLVSVCRVAGGTRMSRSGLSVTAAMGDQSRVCLLQRLGLPSRAVW